MNVEIPKDIIPSSQMFPLCFPMYRCARPRMKGLHLVPASCLVDALSLIGYQAGMMFSVVTPLWCYLSWQSSGPSPQVKFCPNNKWMIDVCNFWWLSLSGTLEENCLEKNIKLFIAFIDLPALDSMFRTGCRLSSLSQTKTQLRCLCKLAFW